LPPLLFLHKEKEDIMVYSFHVATVISQLQIFNGYDYANRDGEALKK
jgi:hypothetical protein